MVVEVSHLESLLPLRLAAFYSGQITTAFKLRCILVKTPYRVHAPLVYHSFVTIQPEKAASGGKGGKAT